MSVERVRIAVLGTGTIIRDYHLPVLSDNDRAEVVAAGNLHAASLETLARDFGIPKAYTDFELMAQDPDIDAVVVGLPNYLHAPVTIQMLRAGKHVLCEKPMAMTVAEAQAMVDAADASGRQLMIAYMWRFDREICWLRDVVDAGTLGSVFKIKAQSVVFPGGPALGSWFVRSEYAGGGALADMGVHSIDTISSLFHDAVRPIRVFAQVGTHFSDIDVDDTANLMVEYDNGMTAIIEAGWHHNFADGLEGAMQVFGTEGYARTFPTELHCDIGGAWGQYLPEMPPRREQCDLPMYAAQMDHFIDCVLGDRSPTPDGRQGLQSMILLEAAYRSAESGKSISL